MGTILQLSSGDYVASISTLGAELKSVKHLNGTEFMWQADADIWPRTAPVLFPVVGKLKHDRLLVNNHPYQMNQHGFARDYQFTVVEQTSSSVVLQLLYDQSTLEKYPFDFKLKLSYAWEENTLVCGYEINNLGAQDMYFSIGAHPGFLIPNNDLTQYSLVFNETEDKFVRHLLTDGLFNHQTQVVAQQTNTIDLSKELFDLDALVFKDLKSTEVSLQHHHSTYAVTLNFSGFPYLGIWSKKNMERFVCLEPWLGHADWEEGHTSCQTKEGMLSLPSHQLFTANYRLRFSI